MNTYFELLTSDKETGRDSQAESLIWTEASDTPTVRASIGPWLTNLGNPSPAAIDLVRVATAALIADRRSRRPAGWTRQIRLRVHAVEPSSWREGVSTLTALLQFLSGDIWDIELVPDRSKPPGAAKVEAGDREAGSAALFSGGLDSFCGALIAEAESKPQVYVSQRDNPTVAASQNRASDWLRANRDPGFSPLSITLAQAQPVLEGTSRTRSLLFLALGLAAAEARGVPALVVPENGFTSLNPPLRTDRSGPLSTRSTHPYTFSLLDLLRDQVGIEVEVNNPYGWLTKGELVARAAQSTGDAAAGLGTTLSCAKLDGRLYKGGNQNWNCGLCVACIIRRGAIAAAGLTDATPYVATRVKKPELQKLIQRRRSDLQAVRWALATGAQEDILLANAEFPADFDLDQAIGLWTRSLEEIKLVALP